MTDLAAQAAGTLAETAVGTAGSPAGLSTVLTMSGGTALMIAAFSTRLSPCRAK